MLRALQLLLLVHVNDNKNTSKQVLVISGLFFFSAISEL